MSIDTVLHYLSAYGYPIIFLFLFCGIVGIPAPEESLLFLIGVLVGRHQLSFEMAALAASSGAFSGMLAAYLLGAFIGLPFVKKYGRFAGVTAKRWEKVQARYEKGKGKTILLGFYMPGIRQISPYFAGISRVPIIKFTVLSLAGTLIWTLPFIAGGYYLGRVFNIDPKYAPYLGLLFLILFLLYLLFRYVKKKRKHK
ncbi:DedA family protein [Peribacillus kribbensis]|uniref:DedA family protein n=1 Tax=Peribacillus kribbensis TaxID=356658 RepID=UPI000410DC25|nr:DedA family protein [Peribacillus kribbensis]